MKIVEDGIAEGRSVMVAHYLILSHLYYEHDVSLVPDATYDRLCARLDECWGSIEHIHKHLIDRSALSAGTGYYLHVPDRVKAAAYSMAAAERDRKRRRTPRAQSSDHCTPPHQLTP